MIGTFLSGIFTSGLSVLSGLKTYLIVGAVTAGIAFAGGYYVKSRFDKANLAEQAQRTVQLVVKQQGITLHLEDQFLHVQFADQQHTQETLDEVPVHVTPEIDLAYRVPCGFVRVFNDAWHGPVPDPAACPDGAPSTVDLSAVGDAEARNAGNYDLVAHQLTALQDWIRQQQKATDAR